MITRIVKLHLHEDKVESFITIYNESKAFIAQSKGNRAVRLVRDIHQSNLLFTISSWDTEDDLNKYRQSDFFAGVWSRVKPLLESKTDAWSLEEI
ncbi:MAG: antibiotic biosynthesis monooxygenase family protein [Bacteroidota bacterium]